MPIEQGKGGTVITGEAISVFRLLSLKGRLKLEIAGLKFRGGSTYALIKREFGFKGTRESVLAQLEKYIEENAPRMAQR